MILVGAFVLTLLLVALSQMREIVLLRGEIAALAQLITSPPDPAVMKEGLPAALRERVAELGGGTSGPALYIIAFLSSDCGPCHDLAEELATLTAAMPESVRSILPVVGERHGESGLRARLIKAGYQVLLDDGTLTKECDVRGTPMALACDRDSIHPTEYSYGVDVTWIVARIATPMARREDAVM